MTEAAVAAMINHTFLRPAGEADAVVRLCEEVRRFKFACAMVNPCEVKHAVALLDGSGARVGTVVDFPLGQGGLGLKLQGAVCAVREGARDIDYVIDIRKLKAAAADTSARTELADDLLQMNAHAKGCANGVVTKLIIECCYLSDDEKVLACTLARQAGFDFVKTSTGFGPGGATAADVKLMRETVGPDMGVKAAGGIHNREEALAMIEAGATRIGASSGIAIVSE